MNYKLISYYYNNKKCWTIFDNQRALCPIFSSVYSALNRKDKATSTQRLTFIAIAFFYSYFEQKHKCSFDYHFKSNGYQLRHIINESEGFKAWLDSDRNGINVVAFDGSQVNVLATRTYVAKVLKFFDFLNERYTTRKYQNFPSAKDEGSTTVNNKFLIKAKREEITTRGSDSSNNNYKSLTEYQVIALNQVTYPHTPRRRNDLNPFKEVSNSFRNHLMIKTFFYGLRRGELHLLTTQSFKPSIDEKRHYITITNCEGDDVTVKNDSSIKTVNSHRTVQINKRLYDELTVYVERFREKSDSNRLFVMTQRNINLIFEQITKAVHKYFPETADINSEEYIGSIYPHCLRHTFAVEQLRELVDIQGMTLDEAQTHLRPMGGWCIDSKEPEYYGSQFIALKANEVNIERINREEQ